MIAKAGEKGRNNMVYMHGESCGNRNMQKLVLPEKVRLSGNSSTTYLHYLAFQSTFIYISVIKYVCYVLSYLFVSIF